MKSGIKQFNIHQQEIDCEDSWPWVVQYTLYDVIWLTRNVFMITIKQFRTSFCFSCSL